MEGDFVAEVRVAADFTPSATSSAEGRVPFLGAGFVLMASERTYVRLERAAFRRDFVSSYASWELRRDGDFVVSGDTTTRPMKGKEARLRLERKGDKLLAAVSEDGKEWFDLPPIEVKLPAKVKLGVTANSTCTEPFAPHFERFRLRTLKRE